VGTSNIHKLHNQKPSHHTNQLTRDKAMATLNEELKSMSSNPNATNLNLMTNQSRNAINSNQNKIKIPHNNNNQNNNNQNNQNSSNIYSLKNLQEGKRQQQQASLAVAGDTVGIMSPGKKTSSGQFSSGQQQQARQRVGSNHRYRC
jgi:hypothetical protein